MKILNRMMTNICSKNLDESKVFYTSLFDFSIDYDSDWFIHLISKDKQLELGIINATHEIVPKSTQTRPEGFYITFVVEKADDIFQIAKNEGFDIVSEPTDTFYGQRRLLLRDPNGVIVDVSSPIPNFQF
ncbi:MAG: VOC family protein [Fulvivirga sp.]